jgi:uncharacterized protein YjbI with pentapeptide repeats
MANPVHLAKLKEGVEAWNQWRKENPDVIPDMSRESLSHAELIGVNLRDAKLRKVDLSWADLGGATFRGADLSAANLRGAHLFRAFLREADLRGADLSEADLRGAQVIEANLSGANLSGARLTEANLSGSRLIETNLHRANLDGTHLRGADLSGARLSSAILIGTILEEANLTGCNVYGVSAWDVQLEGSIQSNLVATPPGQSAIQVDNLEVAQFVYLLLKNERVRQVIDTITSKVVLILGRFTAERKAVLDAIRAALRKRDYLPILFDFQKPDSKDLTGTVATLANMARFIIADLTDPSSIPYELGRVVPNTKVPVQAIILDGKDEFAMFNDLLDYRWVLPPYRYQSEETLLASLNERVIAPAEAKVIELRQK